ncbi:MAG TPA: DUF4013 domain-containing protein [Longilinea sp.]|nr:DUF4013 domain-containing protein [Longilinea sp.]
MSTITEGLQSIFTFPFKGEHWQERFAILALFALIVFIPLVPAFFLLGYCGRMMRGVIDGNEPAMPAWDDWGRMFTDGLKMFAVLIIYMLPAFVLLAIGYGLTFVSQLNFASQMNPEDYTAAMEMFLHSLGGTWLIYFGFLLTMVVGVFVPPVVTHMIAKDQFAAAFHFGEWWKVFRANLAGFLIADALVMGVYMALTWVVYFLIVSVILCCVSPFAVAIGTAYMALVTYALFGRIYHEGVQKLAALPAQPQTGVVV